MKHHLIYQIFVSVLLLCQAQAGGVLVYKNHASFDDSFAHAIPYDSIENHGFVIWVNAGDKKLRFEKSQFHVWIELPKSLPAQIANPNEIASINFKLGEVEKFTNRFKKAEPLTKASIGLLRGAAEQLQSGNVRYQSTWIPKQDYEKILADTLADAEKRQEMEKTAKLEALERERMTLESEAKQRIAEAEKARQEREAKREARVAEVLDEIQAIRAEISELESKIIALGRESEDLAAKNNE